MSGNMDLYEAVRSVPQEAQKTITAGRLRGMTDINPMWRIKVLTERFGPCGEGWGYTIERMWTEHGANGEICAMVQIGLWYRTEDGEKSDPIPGIGGNMLVTAERNGLYTCDECYKKALTDAISVAAKALGVGADVYWNADATKYTPSTGNDTAPNVSSKNPTPVKVTTSDKAPFCAGAAIGQMRTKLNISKEQFVAMRSALVAGGAVPDVSSKDMTQDDVDVLENAIRLNFLQDGAA